MERDDGGVRPDHLRHPVATYAALAARLQRQSNATVAQLLSDGESDRIEFESTARVNLRNGEKDQRMEQVIVKTVSAFLNVDGGTLLIGVADDGTRRPSSGCARATPPAGSPSMRPPTASHR